MISSYIFLFPLAAQRDGKTRDSLLSMSGWENFFTFLTGVLAFCRIAIGLVFLLSSFNKARDISRFQVTIVGFKLTPLSWSRWLAFLGIGCEAAIVVLMVPGGVLLIPGFLLAIALLVIFCGALLSVLIRKITASCDCFGENDRLVSPTDLWRNGGLIICALVGCLVCFTPGVPVGLNWFSWLTLGLGAAIFVTVLLHVGEIFRLFRPRQTLA
jgi:Methylamine utilisation protein MauE